MLFFEQLFASISVFVAVSIKFLPYFSRDFLVNDKKPYLSTYLLYFGSIYGWITHFYDSYPIVRVILALSSISSCLPFWSANHTSMNENSKFSAFNIVNKWDDILISWPNGLFGTKVKNILDTVDNCYWLN